MKAKEIRNQVRNVVKEVLPEILTQEQFKALEAMVNLRITAIEKSVKDTMRELSENHKNTMGYLVRQVTSPKDPNEQK